MEVLIITPFPYALEQQVNRVREKLFVENILDCRIHAVKALPSEFEEKLHGKQYDFMWIDTVFSPDEVGKMREHLAGFQHKQIERF